MEKAGHADKNKGIRMKLIEDLLLLCKPLRIEMGDIYIHRLTEACSLKLV